MDDKAKTIFRGSRALIEFLGPNQTPVAPDVAQRRATRCATCQLNRPAKDWAERVASGVAQAAKQCFRIKDRLNLHVDNEAQLGICQACFCPIKLKIWMPIEHIEEHTSDEVMVDFAETCWIPEELQRP